MKKIADIRRLKSWDALQKMGFKPTAYTFQGLAKAIGAELNNVEIRPSFCKPGLWDIFTPHKTIETNSRNILKALTQ